MTKKDYELIAYCIFTTNIAQFIGENLEKKIRREFAIYFAKNLLKENPRFNLDKFLIACGFKPEKK